MDAQTIWTIVVVLLVLVWLAQLFLLFVSARNQGSDPYRIVSGAAIFFPVPLPVAQMAPGLVDRVGGFWESLANRIFGGRADRGSATTPGYGPATSASGATGTQTAEARLLIDGAEYPLSLPRTRLGRYPNNEVVIDHATVSAYHAEIIRRPDNRHEIVDRESRNGTRVNGALIRSQILKDGDLITLGGATLHYLSSPSPGQAQMYRPDIDEEQYRPGGATGPINQTAETEY
jgi:hypothetical protein